MLLERAELISLETRSTKAVVTNQDLIQLMSVGVNPPPSNLSLLQHILEDTLCIGYGGADFVRVFLKVRSMRAWTITSWARVVFNEPFYLNEVRCSLMLVGRCLECGISVSPFVSTSAAFEVQCAIN